MKEASLHLNAPRIVTSHTPPQDPSSKELMRSLLMKQNRPYQVPTLPRPFLCSSATLSFSTQQHKIGRALFHPGDIIHESSTLKSGERWNLIGLFYPGPHSSLTHSPLKSPTTVWWKASFKFAQFMELPIEIQEMILSFVSAKDLVNIACCSKAFHSLANSEALWQVSHLLCLPLSSTPSLFLSFTLFSLSALTSPSLSLAQTQKT